jgi:tetratricopeptide (TPR) repeat protein
VIVDRIFSRLSEARAVLGQPARRKSYLARLERARSYAGGGSEAAAAAEEVYFTGVEHLKGRRYDQAVDALRQATVLVPGQSGYHGALAWAIYRRAPTDEADVAAAQEELEHAVSLDLEDPWIKVSLGRFFEETGLAERALECFEGAAALAPGVAEIEDELRRLRGAP